MNVNKNMFSFNQNIDKSSNFILETSSKDLTNYKEQNDYFEINKPLNQWGEWIYS